MTEPATLTTTEAAEILGVTAETVRTWAKKRRIRHVELPSGQLRFTRSDVDAVLTPVEPATPTEPAGVNK